MLNTTRGILALQDVSARYGHPVVVLNLVKSAEKRPRETILRKEFAIAVAYINQQVCVFALPVVSLLLPSLLLLLISFDQTSLEQIGQRQCSYITCITNAALSSVNLTFARLKQSCEDCILPVA